MPRFDAFTGPYNTPYSPNIQSELTINWLPETNAVSVEGQGTEVHNKNVRCSLIRMPGLKTFVTLPLAPCRGVFPGEWRLFAVGGDHYYEIKSGGAIIDRSTPGFSGASGIGPAGGTIGNDNRPVQWFSNGNQVMLISAGNVYIDNGNGPVKAQFSDPLTDLVVDSADTSGKTLTTATGGFFDASDVGRTVMITGGGGFDVGLSQPILSVNTSGEAIGASAWGTPGASLGTGVEFIGEVTRTDLHLVTPTVISSSIQFGPSDVGTTITIASSSGFSPGSYTITGLAVDESAQPNGNAILDRAAGTAGSTGGSGTTESEYVTAFQGAFLDGYFFAAPYPLTKSVFYSGAPDGTIDGTMWDPLNYFTKTDYPDNVIALYADHEELYTAGDLENTEVWRDVGDANNPFMPDPGANMHYGCQSPFSFTRLGNGVAWIAQDTRRGTRKAVHAVGYQPQVVSTPAVSAAWARYSQIEDAVAYTLMFGGHELWVITFPSANATWCYDATTGWWIEWGWWNGAAWDRHRVWVHCVVALDGVTDAHYGGDWSTGQIYTMSMQYKTDDGNPIVRRRRAPHNTNENQRRFYARFEIDCDVLGLQRIFWNRCGNGRDRIWQMDSQQSSETGGVTLTLGFSDDRTQSFKTMFTQTLDPTVDVQLANAYLKWVDASWN
jgi:hypothetical protein